MKNCSTLIFLLLTTPAFAGDTFFRAHDANSVILGPLCTPAPDGIEKVDIDFNTTNLQIRIKASGDGVDTAFTYTGVNIDDYDGTPPAWGNPTTSAVEVEDDDDCIRLHIRDEVLAVASATEWTIEIEDTSATPTFADWEYQVLALGTSADTTTAVTTALTSYQTATEPNVNDNETKIDIIDTNLDTITGAAGAVLDTDALNADALAADAVDEIIDEMPTVSIRTTIATLASQTSFTLTAGSTDDNAYNSGGPKCWAFFTDVSTTTQKAAAPILDYTGATKTVLLGYDPGVFTLATTDIVEIVCGI